MKLQCNELNGSSEHAASATAACTLAHESFEAQAQRSPDKTAVVHRGSKLSYAQLNRRANQLARHLIDCGVQPDSMVGICLSRSVDMIAAILAIWKAGGAYVPIDPAYPTRRIGHMLRDSGVGLVLTQQLIWEELEALDVGARVHPVFLDTPETDARLRGYSGENLGLALPDSSLAYVIYTSGSSGVPKGVLVEHRSLANLFEALARALDLERLPEGYNALQNASISFDSSIKQLLHITRGAALHILPEEARRDARKFLDYIANKRIHCFDCTPSLIKVLLRELSGRRLADHEICLLIGGEAIDPPLWQALAQLDNTRCFNVYGPTECTVDTTCAPIELSTPRPVIGRPLANVRCFVLDERQNPLEPGHIGELYVGGAGLARGYLNNERLTAERFPTLSLPGVGAIRLYRSGDVVRLLADGNLEFIGRVDDQVKVRGYRIELGEIESHVKAYPGVLDAVAVADGASVETRKLSVFLILDEVRAASTPAALIGELKKTLRGSLPDYMVPDIYRVVEFIPLTPSGKADRAALMGAPGAGPADEYRAARSDTERALLDIWRALLDSDGFGAEAHFFHLGGHSLLVMQLISSVRERFGVELTIREVFDNPRLGALAESIERRRRARTAPVKVLTPAASAAEHACSREEELLYRFGGHLSPPMLMRFEMRGALDAPAFLRSVERIIRRHEILGATLHVEDGQMLHRRRDDACNSALIDIGADSPMDLEALIEANAYALDERALHRAVLFRLASDRHVFMLAMGHMVSDIWSFDIFLKELMTFYAQEVSGADAAIEALPAQYRDYSRSQALWLEQGLYAPALAYWLEKLRELPAPLALPTDAPRRGDGVYLMRTVPIELPAPLMAAVNRLCRRSGATPYIVLLAAFNVLLARLTRQTDIAVICPASSRLHTALENLIGCFLNLLVLRNAVDFALTFEQLLERVRGSTLDAYSHQEVPALVLQGALAQALGHFPIQLFQVCFDYNPALRPLQLPGVEIADFLAEQINLPGERAGVAFDFIWMLREGGDGVSGRISYNAKLFSEDTVTGMAAAYVDLLSALVARPQSTLAGSAADA